MAEYFAVLGNGSDGFSESDIKRILDPSGRTAPAVWRGAYALVAARAGCVRTVPSGDGDWLIWFVGEVPTATPPPWDALVRCLSEGDEASLGRMNGWFAALVIHERSGRAWAVSDRRAQQPLFHYKDGDALYVSSEAATFCRLPRAPAFDTGWLFETIYFNYPVLDRSFLEGVSRVPPATIMSWQAGDNSLRTRSWSAPFSRGQPLVSGPDAAAFESETFRAVASDYFEPDEPLAVALTAGFDSRAALAAAPRCNNVLTYTYGLPGCAEVQTAARLAGSLGLEHCPIELSDRFTENLASHMVAAVRDSDGLERVLRAELLAVYPLLAEVGRAMALGGQSGDHLFRDHPRAKGHIPHPGASFEGRKPIAPAAMAHSIFMPAFGRSFDAFQQHVCSSLDGLLERHGDLRRPEGYLRYFVYETAPKHFGGEGALANNFLRFRVPYWDPRMVQLAFTTEGGTVGLSEKSLTKDVGYVLTKRLEASIIRDGLVYGGGAVHGIRASTWAEGKTGKFRLEQSYARARRHAHLVFFGRPAGLLSWPSWLAGPARNLCEELLGPEARLRQYLDEAFLDSFVPASDLRLATRLLSAELVLRLVENGWPPDFRVNGAG